MRKASSLGASSATLYCSAGPSPCQRSSQADATAPTTAADAAALVVACTCRRRPQRRPIASRRGVPHSTWAGVEAAVEGGLGGAQYSAQPRGDGPAAELLHRTCAWKPGVPSHTSTTWANAKLRRPSTGLRPSRKASNSWGGGWGFVEVREGCWTTLAYAHEYQGFR